MMLWIKAILKSFFLPPGLFFVLVIVAFFLQFRKKLLAALLCLFAMLMLFFLSTPQVAHLIGMPLEENILPLSKAEGAQAIVILGAGQRKQCLEFEGQSCVNSVSLGRVTYGAYLHKKLGLPVLVSGGKLFDDQVPEAQVMADALREFFAVPTKWVEDRSENTRENAEYSSELLKKSGINHIILVTDAWHMRRAILSFSSTQLSVFPAPTNFTNTAPESTVLRWLPRAESLLKSSQSLHEWLGYIWYRISIP